MDKQILANIFNESQESVYQHKELLIKLRRYYDKCMDKRIFWDYIIEVSKRYLICKYRDSSIGNGINFLCKFCSSIKENATVNFVSDVRNDDVPKSATIIKVDVHQFFSFLLTKINASNPIIKFRICQFFYLIFKNLGDTELDESIYLDMYNNLIKKLKDKSPLVRSFAILAMAPFQDANNTKCIVIKEFLFLLAHDPFYYVRQKVILNVILCKRTLPVIINQCRDIQPSIRKSVFEIIGEKVPIKYLSISQRLELLSSGLYDKYDAIKKVCYERLVKPWLAHFNHSIICLLSFLDVENSQHICMTVLKMYFQSHAQSPEHLIAQLQFDPTYLLQLGQCNQFHYHLKDDKESHIVEDPNVPCVMKCYLAEALFYWTYLITHIKSVGPKSTRSIIFELTVPLNTSELVDWVEMYVEKRLNQQIMKNETLPLVEKTMKAHQNNFILRQFLILFHLIDMADEAGRKRLLHFLKAIIPKLAMFGDDVGMDDELCSDMVKTFAMCHYAINSLSSEIQKPEKCDPQTLDFDDLDRMAAVDDNIWVNENTTNTTLAEVTLYNGSDALLIPNVLEIISEIMHPLVEGVESSLPPKTSNKLESKLGIRAKSSNFQCNGYPRSLEGTKSHKRRSEGMGSTVKTSLPHPQDKPDKAVDIIPPPSLHTLGHALNVAMETFKIYVCHRRSGSANNSLNLGSKGFGTVKPLYEHLIIPGQTSQSVKVRSLAFRSLGLMCMMDHDFARQKFALFLQPLLVDEDLVKEAVLQVLFDLLILYPDLSCPCDTSHPKPDTCNPLTSPVVNDFGEIERPITNGGDGPTNYGGSFFGEEMGKHLYDFLTPETSSNLQIECAKGVMKLILFGRLHSLSFMQKLLSIPYDVRYIQNYRIHKIINAFYSLYSLHNSLNQILAAKVTCSLISSILPKNVSAGDTDKSDRSDSWEDLDVDTHDDKFQNLTLIPIGKALADGGTSLPDIVSLSCCESLNVEALLAFVLTLTDRQKLREKFTAESYMEKYGITPHAYLARHITRHFARLNTITEDDSEVAQGIEALVERKVIQAFIKFLSILTLTDDSPDVILSIGREWKRFDVETLKNRQTKKLLIKYIVTFESLLKTIEIPQNSMKCQDKMTADV